MDSKDNDVWNDYSNSLMLYERIENLYNDHLIEKSKLNEQNKELINNNMTHVQRETKNVIRNKDMIKANMYNYDIINYYNDEFILKKKVMELSEDIMTGIDYIYDIFRLCKESNVFLSFNGGKDAVVILHLFRCAYAKYLKDMNIKRKKPQLIYFKDEMNEFPEVYQFLNESAFMFDFHISIIKGTWKNGITNFIESVQKKYQITIIDQLKTNSIDSTIFYSTLAFINGTRFNDTNTEKLQILNVSSRGLPPYLYVNPVFYWTYGAIWTFILYFKFNYCILYDHGYSSIGSIKDTVKNEFLKCNDCYLPAYFLKNWNYERYNRIQPNDK